MRLIQSSLLPTSRAGNSLEQYVGNMAESLVRARAERDIRNARAAAEAAIRMRSSFLENMNHELRTPLNAIIGFAGMLEQASDYGLNEEQRSSYAEYILQSADLLLGHINTILEIAALDNGSVEPIHQPMNVYHVIEAAVGRVKVRARAENTRILCAHEVDQKHRGKAPPELDPIWVDEERIGQALDHLLQTSIISCKGDGKIYIRTNTIKKGWLDIQIRDDGEGFSDTELADALSAFGNVQSGLERPFAGPGVGISIAKTFIEMQGGSFQIRSRKQKGTLITISLPFASAAQIAGDQQSHSLEIEVAQESDPKTIPLANSA